MISETTRSRNPAGHAGLLQNLLALASALVDFFESRFALLAEESKAALVQLLVLASYLVLALILCAFGYVFLIASAVVGLAHLAGISWLWTALMAADRKSTRLNSSHVAISYAVFCLKKKTFRQKHHRGRSLLQAGY